jgi:bifunctional DNA-binding transcriptional regulator/antitoxin component of YhaV-PrlF toxin-antitoxin module
MAIAKSKITEQGQTVVPTEVMRKLGVRPGATIAWEERDDTTIVRRVGEYSFANVHQALFGASSAPKTKLSIKDGIKKRMQLKHGC